MMLREGFTVPWSPASCVSALPPPPGPHSLPKPQAWREGRSLGGWVFSNKESALWFSTLLNQPLLELPAMPRTSPSEPWPHLALCPALSSPPSDRDPSGNESAAGGLADSHEELLWFLMITYTDNNSPATSGAGHGPGLPMDRPVEPCTM